MSIFATTDTHLLGTVTDLKHMARYSDYLLNGNLGLKKLAKLLQANDIVTAHFAGSDSFLTASCQDEGNSQVQLKDIRRLFICFTISHSKLSTTSCKCRSIQVNPQSYLNILDIKTVCLFVYIYIII